MVIFFARIVLSGEASSVSFGEKESFKGLCDKIRVRFPQTENSSFRLKYVVHPDTTVVQLENEEDMLMLFRVLQRHGSDLVDINVHPLNETNGACADDTGNEVNIGGDSVLLELNEYLGCFRRDDAKMYLSNNWKNFISCEGQIFEEGVKEFRMKLRMYAIERGFEYEFETNKPARIVAICKKRKTEGCNWCVKASLLRHNNFFHIYSLVNEHSCRLVVRLQKSRMVSSAVVKEVMLDKVRENPNCKAIDIQKDLKLNYGLDIPYHMAWYGKELAREVVLGVEAHSYRELKWFVERTIEANPGSRVDFQCYTQTEVPTPKLRFQRMFVSYRAQLNGFQFCRPVLHIDATFITNKYRGMLLAATAKDANCGLYPVAYAIVDSETESNWSYFLSKLAECLSEYPTRTITFISDRNIGLLNAVRDIFPNSPLGFCYRHLQANLINKYSASSFLSKRIPYLFMLCAYSRTEEYFQLNLQILRKEGGAVVDNFLKDLPSHTWASCHFKGERFGEMTNNLAECFNYWVKDLKGLPIVQFNEQIRKKTMDLIASRKHESTNWTTELCPNLEKKLHGNLELGRHWPISRSDTHVYEVECDKYSVKVNLENSSCSCGEWQVLGFPCSHALAVVQKHGGDIYSYVNPLFKVSMYRETYSYTINPVPTISKSIEMVSQSIDVDPPSTKRPAGRPRVGRYNTKNEKVKRIVKCGRCKKIRGHNKKTCKEVI